MAPRVPLVNDIASRSCAQRSCIRQFVRFWSASGWAMIVVTGGAGFIGSNLVASLAADGHDVIVVDDLADGRKPGNIASSEIVDYIDKDDLPRLLETRDSIFEKLELVLHQGAITTTTDWDSRRMIRENYEFSKRIFLGCRALGARFLYASSAAVYGVGTQFSERPGKEAPLNPYAHSKALFDRFVSSELAHCTSQVVGLRYFNVYGPGEAHKRKMASLVLQLWEQLVTEGAVRLFGGSHGYGDGEQRRDFIHVDDVVAVNRHFIAHPELRGIYNVGTGRSRSFNDLAHAVIESHGSGRVEYVPFPAALRDCYQSFTQADISALRASGYSAEFVDLEAGVGAYVRWLESQRAAHG